jgi:hypothetical protein
MAVNQRTPKEEDQAIDAWLADKRRLKKDELIKNLPFTPKGEKIEAEVLPYFPPRGDAPDPFSDPPSPVVPAPSPVVPQTQKYGASGTTLEAIKGGALEGLGLTPAQLAAVNKFGGANFAPAVKLAQAFVQKPDPVNNWRVALDFFSTMAANMKPGVTALGAAGSAAKESLAYLRKRREAEKARKATLLPTAIAIMGAMKPKGGVPKSVMGGPVTNEGGSPVLDQTTGKPLYKYTTYGPDGTVIGTFNAPMKGGGVNIKTPFESSFVKGLGTGAAKRHEDSISASEGASTQISTLQTMGSILAQETFETGKIQEFMLPIRQWMRGVGISTADINNRVKNITSESTGADGVINAEIFRSSAAKLVLESVAKLKGALSEKELSFLETINPSLGMTKESNQILILLAQQQLEKIKPYSSFTMSWQEANGPLKSAYDLSKMNKAFKSRKGADLTNPYQYIMKKADDLEKRELLIAEKGLDKKLPRQADGTLMDPKPGQTDPYAEIRQKIRDKINRTYPIAEISAIFKDSAFYPSTKK